MPDPNKAWTLFMSDPVTFILIFAAVVVVAGGFAWWLRGYIGKERIDALNERLTLAREGQATVTHEVETLRKKVADQHSVIARLRLPPIESKQLFASSATVADSVTALSTANNALATTLTLVPGRYQVIVSRDPIKRST